MTTVKAKKGKEPTKPITEQKIAATTTTKAAAPKTTWQDRLKDERNELADKIKKLDVALNTKKTPKSEEDILRRQVHAMRKYKQILDERLGRL